MNQDETYDDRFSRIPNISRSLTTVNPPKNQGLARTNSVKPKAEKLKKQKPNEFKEPQDWVGHATVIGSNLMEEGLLLLAILVCGGNPSYVSLIIFVSLLPILYKKGSAKIQSLNFNIEYSKNLLIAIFVEIIIKILVVEVYIQNLDLTQVDKATLNSWGIYLTNPKSGVQEVSLSNSIEVEFITVFMLTLIYVLSRLFKEDLEKDNNLMITSTTYARFKYLFAGFFYLLAFSESMFFQNLINFGILALLLSSLIRQSIYGGKKNESYNYQVVFVILMLISLQFFEYILFTIPSIQRYMQENPFSINTLVIIIGQNCFIPTSDEGKQTFNKQQIQDQLITLISCMLLGTCWRSSKAIQIEVHKRELLRGPSSNRDQSLTQDLHRSTDSYSRQKNLQKLGIGLLNQGKMKYQVGLQWIDIRNEFFSLKPWTLTWIACLFECLVAYVYNNKQGLIHLSWVLLACILPLEVMIYISLIFMGPFLFVLFFFMYTREMRNQILLLQENQGMWEYFSFDLKYFKPLELTFLFIIVVLFSLMYNSYQYVGKKNQMLRNGLFKRIRLEGQSTLWCLLFIFLRYIHLVVLLILFIRGVGEVSFYNLGLMFFFIIFAMSQRIYRKAGFLLVIFLSSFIWGQYLWTIIYQQYEQDQTSQTYQILQTMDWTHDVDDSRGAVFQYIPPIEYWLILILTLILQLVNSWFQDPKDNKEADDICDDKISRLFPSSSKFFKRAGYIIKECLIVVIVIFMAFVVIRQVPTVINFFFILLFSIFLGFILGGEEQHYKTCITLCKCIKWLAGMVLMLNMAFYLITESKILNNTSIDEKFWEQFPELGKNLDIIGFNNFNKISQTKIKSNSTNVSMNQDVNEGLWWQLASYLLFLFVGNILHYLYQSLISSIEQEEKVNMIEVFENEKKLVNFHEQNRFTMPYFVYKLTKYWSIFDSIALYFHILTNMIILGFAIYFEVSLFMALNIICIGVFYIYSALHLHSQTKEMNLNLGDKIGLDRSYEISKNYRSQGSTSFMNLRKKLWYFQYVLLIIAIVMIYPSAIFDKLMVKYKDYQETFIDVFYYMFWCGFYKGAESRKGYTFLIPQFVMIVLLICEKISQRWLLGRFGCTLQKIAFFREAEMRIDLIKSKEQNPSELPKYEETLLPTWQSYFITQGEARKVVNDIKKKFSKPNIDSNLKHVKTLIKENIKRQTRISRAKVLSISIQQLSLLCLLLSCLFKSNIISCVYLGCILLYVFSKSKTTVMPYILTVVGVSFMLQYTVYLLNLYQYNSPQQFPSILKLSKSGTQVNEKYAFPIFGKIDFLKDINNAFFFAMGVHQGTLRSLWIDLINLYLMTLYFLVFKNPILRRSVQVSWKKTETLVHQGESMNKQDALEEYRNILYQKNPNEDKITPEQRLQELRQQVVSYDFEKEISSMIYLTSHIFTMVVVLLLAILGRSIISLGYIFILLPYIFTSLNFIRIQSKSDPSNPKKAWSFIFTLTYVIAFYSYMDFMAQVIFQFPYFSEFYGDQTLGLRKAWYLINPSLDFNTLMSMKQPAKIIQFNFDAVSILISKCAIIYLVSLQKEVYNSRGFKNFIDITRQESKVYRRQDTETTKTKGLARLYEIRNDKALCLTYQYNNAKLREIVKIQRRKKQTQEVVGELKQKIRLWRERHYEQVAQQVFPISQGLYHQQSLNASLLDQRQNRESFLSGERPTQEYVTATVKSKKTLPDPKMSIKLDKKAQIYNRMRSVKRRLPMCARFYQMISKKLINSILFVQNREYLAGIKKKLHNGETAIFTALDEKIMLDIKVWLRGQQMNQEEGSLFDDKVEKTPPTELKFENMRYTQEFIKTKNLMKHMLSDLGLFVASNTSSLAYLFMIVSMYSNATLLTIGYPILVFGYALMEETRPGKNFWRGVLIYTVFILMLKFTYQFFNTSDTALEQIQTDLKLGLQAYKDNTWHLFLYILPETLILYFILTHQIQNKLLGFHCKDETQIESIQQAIYRSIGHDKDQANAKEESEMVIEDLVLAKKEANLKLQRQDDLYCHSSQDLMADELQFDVNQYYFFDAKRRKTKFKHNNSFIDDRQQLGEEMQRIKRQKKEQKAKGLFDRWRYFQRLFPKLKIQKPGMDLYLFNTLLLFVIFFYIMFFYEDMIASGISTGQKASLNFSMVLLLIFHIGLLVTERMISRTDTKVSKRVKRLETDLSKFTFNTVQQKQWNSMSMHIKTIRRDEMDLADQEAQFALQDVQEFQQKYDNDAIEINKTKTTIQQKTKFIIHWVMLILVHIAVFWFYPITGNLELYGIPNCSDDLSEFPYGCKNFNSNNILQIAYVMYLLYFLVSALQIKYGLPQYKVVTTTANDNDISYVCHLIYAGAPWVMELKVIVDFLFTKTAMDIFQWWQFNRYYSELYIAKMGNKNYYLKQLGAPIRGWEKFFCGFCCFFLTMTLFISPLILFSDIGASTPNLVKASTIELNMIIHNLTEGSNSAPLTYNLYKTQNPFIQSFTQNKFEAYGFDSRPETKFFNYDQVQSVRANRYSDEQWQISQGNLAELTSYLEMQYHQDASFEIIVQLKYFFSRDGPKDFKVASGTQELKLDLRDASDSQTLQQFIELKNINCDLAQQNQSASQQNISLNQFYVPVIFIINYQKLQLGATAEVKNITYLNESQTEQLHDMQLIYKCRNQWIILDDEGNDVEFVVFNEDITSSFLEGYSLLTFYLGVVLAAGTLFRTNLLFVTPLAFIYEISDPDQLLILCEYIVQMRHEGNIVKEEEAYLMFVEVLRSPELCKALTGSSLKGELGPKRDYL